MKRVVKLLTKCKIVFLILIIFTSIYITIKTKEQFPKLVIKKEPPLQDLSDLSSYNHSSFKDCQNHYSNIYLLNRTILLEDITINQGDRIDVKLEWNTSQNIGAFATLNTNNYQKLKEGVNEMGIIYYKEGKNIIQIVFCYNLNEPLNLNPLIDEIEKDQRKRTAMKEAIRHGDFKVNQFKNCSEVSGDSYCIDLSNPQFASLKFIYERPSFIDSPIGYVLVFFASFIMLGESFKLILFFLKSY